MRDKNNVLVWLHVELVICPKTFMLIHNKKGLRQGEQGKHFNITWVFTDYKQSAFCNPFKVLP